MAKLVIDIPDYSSENGIKLNWKENFLISVLCTDNYVKITGNEAGLTSLANHLLNLAQFTVPTGTHIHLDEINALEEYSTELIIEKIE